jgi:ribonuclease T2
MAPSLRSLYAYASNLLSQLPLLGTLSAPNAIEPYIPLSGAPSCPIDGPMSCHNSTPIEDGSSPSCCFVHPGGRVLLTQFWDREAHVDGAEQDWTIHGLWPDRCDGSYDQFCRYTGVPQFSNITALLAHHGQQELLEFMDRYWPAAFGSNAGLWAHEYNKHGTCINTLAPRCYGEDYQVGMEVVDYFVRAAGLFRTLDTYLALERQGFVPDAGKAYALEDIQRALEKFSGGKVVLRCTGGGRDKVTKAKYAPDVLHEVWYVYFVKGSLQSGQFVPAQELGHEGNAGNCADQVRYLPKRIRGDEL